MINIICSKTGSDGNFSFITDRETNIAIDCGIQYSKANKMCEYNLLESKALLLTHAHQDHSAYLKDFISKGINTYVPNEVWLKQEISRGYERYKHTIDGTQIKIGTFVIKPFKVPHTNSDGTDCENYGFLIYSKVTKEKMLWITDCMYISNQFPACEYICIECNYIDIDDYSEELKYINKAVEIRRLKSHLSLNHCVDFIKMQDLSKVKYIKLLHLTKSQGIIEEEIKERFKKEFPNIEVRI